jgi:hypothetical protein
MTTVAWDDGSDVERRQHGMVMGWDDDHPPPASRATARGVDRGWSYKEAPQPSDHDSTPYRYYEPLLMGWKGVLCEKYGGRLHNAPTPSQPATSLESEVVAFIFFSSKFCK